jgi:hypothetical protein
MIITYRWRLYCGRGKGGGIDGRGYAIGHCISLHFIKGYPRNIILEATTCIMEMSR